MKVSWIGLAGALVVLPAFAGFTVVKPAPPPTVGSSQPLPALNLVATRLVGTPSGTIPVREGFGRQVPLADALQQIAPPGWHARLRSSTVTSFKRNQKVDWEGGRPWPEVLDILVNNEGLSAEVDFYQQLILIGDRSERPVNPTTLAASQPVVVKPVAPADPSTESYTIPAGTSISKGLTAYVKRFGWQMRWNTPEDCFVDTPIPIPAGDVESGVKYVMQVYHAQGGLLNSTQRLAKPNHTVVIEPMSAETRK
ncbi:MAG: TcpQ domain-containing protein [Rhodanobacter sp.]